MNTTLPLGLLLLALLAPLARATPHYEEISNLVQISPKGSSATLVRGADGYLWGVDPYGGVNSSGSLFKLKADDPGSLQVIRSFEGTDYFSNTIAEDGSYPFGTLAEDGHGYLWGTTSSGGKKAGVVFKIRPSDGSFIKVLDLPGTASNSSGLVADGHGYFWLTVGGEIEKIQIATGKLTHLLSFTGATEPNRGYAATGALVRVGEFMWGTTEGNSSASDDARYGTIFKVNIATGQLTTLASFTGPSGVLPGQDPQAALVEDGRGNLWGTTVKGGAGNFGTLFKIGLGSEAATSMADFTGTAGAKKGAAPTSPLALDRHRLLWGATTAGGATDQGTLFVLDPVSGDFTTQAEFNPAGAADRGAHPASGLYDDRAGHFLGLTLRGGGPADRGEVYQVDMTNGALSSFIEFADEGLFPDSPLTPDGTGRLWGALSGYDAHHEYSGMVYAFDPARGGLQAFYKESNFLGLQGELYFDGASTFWGSKINRKLGRADFGTLYAYDRTTAQATTAAEFSGTGNGTTLPGGPLNPPVISDGHGYLWGTTTVGGAAGLGTIYKVEQSTKHVTTVLEFSGANGTYPSHARLWFDGDHTLWGATNGQAGTAFASPIEGTVYTIDCLTGTLTTVAALARGADPTADIYPASGFTPDGAGSLWATGLYGIFKLNLATKAVTKVLTFTNTSGPGLGGSPSGELVSDGNGSFWGVTAGGGTAGEGTVFRVEIATGRLSTMVDFGGLAGQVHGGPHPFGLKPEGPLYRAANGDFIGVTQGDLNLQRGAVFFRISPNSTAPSLPMVNPFVTDALTPNSGALHGGVDPGGLATTAYFEYGLTARYGSKTPVIAIGSDSVAHSMDAPIARLQGHTVYHYRLVAKNSLGTTTGPDSMFKTPNTPPVASDLTVLTTVNYEHFFQDNELGFIGMPKVTDAEHDHLIPNGESLGLYGADALGLTIGLYHPGANFYGYDALTYSVLDGFGGTATGHIYLVNKFFDGLLLSGGVAGGYLTATITATHAFSATLKLGKTVYPLKGAFDANNHYTRTFPAKAPAVPTVVNLDLDLPHGKIQVTVNNGTLWQSELLNGRSVHAPDGAHKYTAALPAPADPALPQGTGYGTMSVAQDSTLTVAGKLGDGSAYSVGAHVRDDGSWVFYAPTLYGAAQGLISGEIAFPATPNGTCGGQLHWTKPATGGAFLPAAFDTSVTFSAHVYLPPVALHTVLDFTGTAGVMLTGGGIGNAITHKLSVSNRNAVTITDPGADHLALTITPATGLLGGSFTNPATGKKVMLNGVIQQGAANGLGLFLGVDQAGSFTLTP